MSGTCAATIAGRCWPVAVKPHVMTAASIGAAKAGGYARYRLPSEDSSTRESSRVLPREGVLDGVPEAQEQSIIGTRVATEP
jgi:hypothetical protein